MSNIEDLFSALSARSELANVKFFLGNRVGLTSEIVAGEALRALTQVNNGSVQAVTSIDGHIEPVSIKRFV